MRLQTISRNIVILFLGVSSIALAQKKATKWNIWSDFPRASKVISPKVIEFQEIFSFPDNQDIQVYSSNNNQTENSIAINPSDPQNLLITTNGRLVVENGQVVNIHQPYFYSTDGGDSWQGSENNPNGISTWGDPVALFNANGDAFYVALGNPGGIYVLKSTNGGANWGTTVNADPLNSSGDDKEHAMTDLSGTYSEHVYVAWTDFSAANDAVVFTRSTNGGTTFSSTRTTLYSGNDLGQGTNIATGPNGEVYVAFANYTNGDLPESGIRFTKSLDGGANFTTANVAFNISGIRLSNGGRPEFNNTRVNSFPSMDIDRSEGAQQGWIYIVYADRHTGDSDIYLRRSTDGGSNWSSAIRVNDDEVGNGKQQWFPSIAVDPIKGTIYVSYFNMDTTGFLTARYVAISNDGGDTFHAYKVSDVRFTPSELGGYTADGYMGDYYEIVANDGKAYASWSDDRTGIFQAYVSKFDGVLDVVIDQQLSTGIRVGTIGRWNGNSFNPRFSPPDTLSFDLHTVEVLHADINIYSNQKYHQWNDDPDVINHHAFTIDTSFTNVLTSRFHPTKPGIILRNEFILGGGVNPANDVIDFKDPWLIDYPDLNYGNNKRNQGMTAPFKSRPAPFNPDYTTNFGNGDIYRGVFLDQGSPNWQPPYYSVRAVNGQQATVNGKDITYDWESWSYNPAEINLQTPGSRETAVVFKQDSATLTANMKGRRVSDTPQATRFNNGRKLTYRRASLTQQKPYLVYQDRGNIYAAFQDANGNWQKDSRIAAAAGGRLNQLPAVAYLEEMSGYQDQHGIAWQEYDPLLNSYRLYSNLANFPDGSPTFEDAPHPAIAGYYLYSPQAPTAVVAYRDSRFSPTDIPDGINLWFTRDGVLASVTSEASADFPTLAQRHYPTSVQWQEPYYMLAWQESAGIRYKEFARNLDSGSQITYAFSSLLNSGYSSLSDNQRPSLYSFGVSQNPDNEEHVYAVWQANYSAENENERSGNPRTVIPAVCFREKDPFLGWLPIQIFRIFTASGDLNPVVSGWQEGESFEAALAYQHGSSVKYLTRQQGIWSAVQTLSSDGVNPALATIGNVPQGIYTENSSSPYRIQHNASLLTGMDLTQALSHSREIHFSLKAMLRHGDRLPFDAQITLRIDDPALISTNGEEVLTPLYRDTSLTAENLFHYREFTVNEPGTRLRLPLALSARIVGGKTGGPEVFEFPMLRLSLMERGKPFRYRHCGICSPAFCNRAIAPLFWPTPLILI